MARTIDTAQASTWSAEETRENIKYLEIRGDLTAIHRVLQLRGESWGDYLAGGDPNGDPSQQTPSPQSTADEIDESKPPTGTVEDVLDWVGDDLSRAEAALDAELEGKGRSTLIDSLESMLEAAE